MPAWLGDNLVTVVDGVAFGVLLFTIAVGIGPRTIPDLAYHLTILAVLVVGLALALRGDTASPRGRYG